ncbi:MAG: hypothetical protein KDA20_12385 [Phycisphaerales bacterium]|nr:hypothetical protein [Phycisphaerales bacterium]
MNNQDANAFYVGYLPLPRAHRRALRIYIPTLIACIAVLGVAFAFAQRDPGPGAWDTSRLREWTGRLQALPYPVLIDDTDGSALLVVEQGKHGPRQAAHTSGHARLRGWLLERNGRRMIELDPAEDALRISAPTTTPPPRAPGPVVELVGEILDAKCYLGAMKPGDGKAHKACATLCIQGGIPPMLYVDEPSGHRRHYLIIAPDGLSAADIVLPFIGEPVSIRGRLAKLADLDLLFIDTGAVTRR